MNGKSGIMIALTAVLLTGCSRTVEDVAKWEAKGNIQKLKDALTDPKVEVRKAAAESLGTLKDEAAVSVLAACLNDEESGVQAAAVNALIAIGTPSTTTPLAAALKLNDPQVRIAATDALGRMKAEGAVESLAQTLDDPDEEVQLAACRAIGKIASESGSQPLANKLATATTPSKIRKACIEALAGTGGPVALKALVDTLADNDESVREAATTSLIRIGDPAIPSIMDGLRSENREVRRASVTLLRGLSAIPTRDSGLVWYQLARASLDEDEKLQKEVVHTLAAEGQAAVPTLLAAAAHSVPEIRETAAESLEWIGETCAEETVNRATRTAAPRARTWLEGRGSWAGAPSWRIDLFGAVSALNPDLRISNEVVQRLQAGGPGAARVLAHPDFQATRAYLPYCIPLFADADCADVARSKVDAAGATASLALIAALAAENPAIADGAAALLADRADPRAFQPLSEAIQRRFDAGALLSLSPLYTALQNLELDDAEPLILKIRPDAARAIRIFSRQFRDVKVTGATTTDPYTDGNAPVVFYIGYTDNGKPGSLEVTFKKDDKGNWRPGPALPYRLPKAE